LTVEFGISKGKTGYTTKYYLIRPSGWFSVSYLYQKLILYLKFRTSSSIW